MTRFFSKFLPHHLSNPLDFHRKKNVANKKLLRESLWFPQVVNPTVPYVYPSSCSTMAAGSLISQRINFCELPQFCASYKDAKAVTFPDLNGNPLLQLHLLVHAGILEAPRDKEKYNLLKNLVCLSCLPTYQLQSQQLDLFEDLLKTLFPIKNKSIFLRWIGDIHAERLSNETLIMKIMSHLHQNQAPFEFILGNHDVLFLILFHYLSKDSPFSRIKELQEGINERKKIPCYSSLDRLSTLIQNHVVSTEDVLTYIKQVYLPHLKLLSYQKNPKGKLAIFSHAILINPAVNGFIKKYEKNMIESKNQILDTDSAENIIDKINSTFHTLLEIKDESLLRDFLGLQEDKSNSFHHVPFTATVKPSPETHPVHFIIWARTNDLLKDYIEIKDDYYVLKPEADVIGILSDTNVTPIHGHTTVTLNRPEQFETSYWTIDSLSGKSITEIETDQLSENKIHTFCTY